MNRLQIPYRTLLLAALLSVLVMPERASSQLSLQAGAGLGFVVASGDYSGTTIDYYNGTKYGFSNGYSILGKARANVSQVNIMLEMDYTAFSASGDTDPGKGSVDISQKIFTIKAGPEYQLVSLPRAPMKPYVGVNLQYNSFRGETTFNGTSRVPSGTYTMTSTSRIGLGFAVGLLIEVAPTQTLDFNISYNLMNMAGKDFTVADPNQPRRGDSYRALNDSNDPLFRTGDDVHFVGNDRSVHTLYFTASYLFGF